MEPVLQVRRQELRHQFLHVPGGNRLRVDDLQFLMGAEYRGFSALEMHVGCAVLDGGLQKFMQ